MGSSHMRCPCGSARWTGCAWCQASRIPRSAAGLPRQASASVVACRHCERRSRCERRLPAWARALQDLIARYCACYRGLAAGLSLHGNPSARPLRRTAIGMPAGMPDCACFSQSGGRLAAGTRRRHTDRDQHARQSRSVRREAASSISDLACGCFAMSAALAAGDFFQLSRRDQSNGRGMLEAHVMSLIR
jgi:hypothetical protein